MLHMDEVEKFLVEFHFIEFGKLDQKAEELGVVLYQLWAQSSRGLNTSGISYPRSDSVVH